MAVRPGGQGDLLRSRVGTPGMREPQRECPREGDRAAGGQSGQGEVGGLGQGLRTEASKGWSLNSFPRALVAVDRSSQ